jgi:HlyD family secretion protein
MPLVKFPLNGAAKAEPKPIELRSEEVQELLGQMPNWLIRWGITVVFTMVLILLLASWLIKYPDVLSSRVMLTTKTPPVSLVARAEGRIRFLAQNKQFVRQGAFLAVIENPASAEDVWYLAEQMQAFKQQLYRSGLPFTAQAGFKENLSLGELQSFYLTLLASLQDYNRDRELNLYEKQIRAAHQSIGQYGQLKEQLEKQQQLMAQELQLAQKQYNTDAHLLREKVIAEADFNRTKNAFLQSERAFESGRSGIINNQIQLSQLQAQITEYRTNQVSNEGRLRSAIQTAFKQLESQLDAWEQKYVLKSPIAGKVAFAKYWSTNQYVTPGEAIMTVVPPSSDLYAQVQMPITGSGKVEVGQPVNLKFDNYPSTEYGMVRGVVRSIALVPHDDLYTIQIALPQGLVTSYRKTLPFRQEMQGTAEIITRDMRLIERIFNQFRALLDNTMTWKAFELAGSSSRFHSSQTTIQTILCACFLMY